MGQKITDDILKDFTDTIYSQAFDRILERAGIDKAAITNSDGSINRDKLLDIAATKLAATIKYNSSKLGKLQKEFDDENNNLTNGEAAKKYISSLNLDFNQELWDEFHLMVHAALANSKTHGETACAAGLDIMVFGMFLGYKAAEKTWKP